MNARFDPQPKVVISPVRDASREADETWYRLYIQVPSAFTVPAALTKFAPSPKVAGLPPGNWSAVSVLAQYKIEKDANPDAPSEIFYYEIVADYDVFAIAPSINDVEMHFRARGSRGRGEVHEKTKEPISPKQDNPARFFHTFSPTRGLISEFESEVRVSLNQSGTGVGWLTTVFAGVAETVLHGCEVNNYFFTETFGDLILAPPTIWRDKVQQKGASVDSKECLQFRFSTDSFLNCLAGVVNQPAKTATIEGKTGEWPIWNAPNTQIGRHWLLQPNLQWAAPEFKGNGLEALDNFFARELKIILQNGYSSPELLLYYGGLYRYLFLEFGKAYDHLISHIDSKAKVDESIEQKQKLTTKLNGIRGRLVQALDCVIRHANLQRAARADQGRRLGIYAAALRAADTDLVSEFDGEYALTRYVEDREDLWVAWLLPRRIKQRPNIAADMKTSLKRLSPFAALPDSEQAKLIDKAAAQLASSTELIGESEKLDESREFSVNRRRERYYPILLLWRKELDLITKWTGSLNPHFGHKELCATLQNQRHSLLSYSQVRKALNRPHSAPLRKAAKP